MEVKMLDWRNHLDKEAGCLCRYVQSTTEYFRPHYHNYYEIFLVMRGNVCHIINGSEQLLQEGQLLFIRDTDTHDYKSADGNSFEFLNLAVSKETLHSLFDYLGEGFPAAPLLHAPFPPSVNLTAKEKEKLFYDFTALNQSMEKPQLKLSARILLLQLFTKYFMHYEQEESEIPLWLDLAYEAMRQPQNFIAGAGRMYQLAKRSREHLTRSLKKYYGVTPSELVTELRLNHASNLLLTSNLSVTDICFDCGFENLSWFYKVFQKKFQTTPTLYRKQFERTESVD